MTSMELLSVTAMRTFTRFATLLAFVSGDRCSEQIAAPHRFTDIDELVLQTPE